jgi:hypothetical protein
MACDRWRETNAIEYSDPIGNKGFYIVSRLTDEFEKIDNCPFCGSKLNKDGCTKAVE